MHGQHDLKVESKEIKPKEPIVILVVANKGGVGKTTSAHNLGYLLASKHKINVLMVDADAQCNLTAVCMRQFFLKTDEQNAPQEKDAEWDNYTDDIKVDLRISRQSEKFYADDHWFVPPFIIEDEEKQKFRKAKKEAAEPNNMFRILDLREAKQPDEIQDFIQKIEPIDLTQYFEDSWEGGKFLLLPGSMDIGQLDKRLMEATTSSIPVARDTFFRPTQLIRAVAKLKQIDVVLVDVNPGNNLLNQALWSGSDYFMIPTEPSMYSAQSVASISRAIVSWARQSREIWQGSLYAKNPIKYPEFLGVYVQKVPYAPKKEGETHIGEATWITKIRSILEQVLLPHLEQINGVIMHPLDSYQLGIISKFDRALSIANTDGYPISAYTYYHDRHQAKLNKINCIRYEDEFLILIDSLLGRSLLKSPEVLRQEIRNNFQLSPFQFERNYRQLRQQLRRSYQDLPSESKLTPLEEDIVCELLYDYSADDIEKVLFSLRGLKNYKQQSSAFFMAYPACSIGQLQGLLQGKYLTAISQWDEIPSRMIFVFYNLNKWHSVRVHIKYYKDEAKYSILIKSPAKPLKQADQVAQLIQEFICQVLIRSGYQKDSVISEDEHDAESSFITSDLNQLNQSKCSGVVALSNVIDFIDIRYTENDNHDFIQENLFSISSDNDEEQRNKRLQVKARSLCQEHLNNSIQWLKENQNNVVGQEQIALLQELSKAYIHVFERSLPEKGSELNKIYRCLDRAYRFIPDNLSSTYQLKCLLILLANLHILVQTFRTSQQHNQLIERRDEIFSLLNVDRLFGSFGTFINWFDSSQSQGALISMSRIIGRYRSKNSCGKTVEWQERELTNSDDGFSALKLTRERVIEILLSKSKDRKIRLKILAGELLINLFHFRNTPSYLKGDDLIRFLQPKTQEKVNQFYQEYVAIKRQQSQDFENIRKLSQEKNPKLTQILGDSQILSAIKNNHLPVEFKELSEAALATEKLKQNLFSRLADDAELYDKYVTCYRHLNGLWLGLPSLKVVAESENINLRIWSNTNHSIGDFEEIKLYQQVPQKLIPQTQIIDVIIRTGYFNFLVSPHPSLDISFKNNKKSANDILNLHISFTPQGQPQYWEESHISAQGGSCGFRALGVSRGRVVEILESKVDDPAIREQILCGELLPSLEYHYTNLMAGAVIENPPTHFMDQKMQAEVKKFYEDIKAVKAKIEADCNQIRVKLDELKLVLPLGASISRDDEFILRCANTKKLPAECKGLARRLLQDQKQLQTHCNKLKNNTEIYLAYVRSYLNEPGLWIGIKTMQIVAQSERIRIHIWGVSNRKAGNFKEIQLEQNTLAEIKAPTAEVNVLLRRGHFNFLFQTAPNNLSLKSEVSAEDQQIRLSILTAERDRLFKIKSKGDQHSQIDKAYDRILDQIKNLEAAMQKSPKGNSVIGQKRSLDNPTPLSKNRHSSACSNNKKSKTTDSPILRLTP